MFHRWFLYIAGIIIGASTGYVIGWFRGSKDK